MRSRYSAALTVFGLVFCACQSPQAPVTIDPPSQVDGTGAETPAIPGKMAALPFRLDLTFSPDAAGAIRSNALQVEIHALYYGTPKPGVSPVNAPGVILNEERYTAEGRNGAVRIRGAFDLDRATAHTQGDPRVRVRVSAASETGEEALACEIFDEALPLAVETGGTIHCQRTGESPPFRPPPAP